MAGRLVAMGGYAGDLCTEEFDAGIEFVQRIAVQALTGEKAGSSEVAFGQPQPRSIVVVHCSAASDAKCMMSIR